MGERGRAVVAREAHNLEVAGSNPVPATKKKNFPALGGIFLFFRDEGREVESWIRFDFERSEKQDRFDEVER